MVDINDAINKELKNAQLLREGSKNFGYEEADILKGIADYHSQLAAWLIQLKNAKELLKRYESEDMDEDKR